MKASSRVLAVTGAAVGLLLVALWLRRGSDAPTGASLPPEATSALLRSGRGPGRLGSGAGPLDQAGAIEGVVRDQRGRALGGATVAVSPGFAEGRGRAGPGETPSLIAHAVTSADGRFRLAPVPPGVYRATASAAGFLPASREDVAVEGDATVADIELVLTAGKHSLSGRVLDVGGGAVPGARVRAFIDAGWSPLAAQPMALSIADREGAYQLTLPDGDHAILVEADGYAPDRVSLAGGGQQRRDFRLHPASTIVGRVVRRGPGSPVAGARVRAVRGAGRDRRPAEAESDSAGEFTIRDLEPGSYALYAIKGSLAGRSVVPVTVGLAARVDGVLVEVDQGRSLSGRVRRRGGAPLPGARVYLREALPVQAASARPPEQAATGAGGAFRFDGLLPGSYTVEAGGPGNARAHRQAVVTLVDVTGVELEVQGTGVVRGRVVDGSGRPAAGTMVFVKIGARGDNTDLFGPARADADGRFRIGDVAPGKLSVSARHPEQGRAFSEAGVLEEAGEREVNLRLGGGVRIRGRVVWDDGAPAAGLVVTASVANDVMADRATTDLEGRYAVGPFEVGAAVYVQVEQAAGWEGDRTADQASRMVRTERSDVQGIDFKLARSDSAIRGVVVGADGRPLGGVVLVSRPGRAGVRALTDDDGVFVLEGLVRGTTYQVIAELAGSPPARVEGVVAGRQDLRIQIEASARLGGKVTRASGASAGPYTVWAQPARAGAGEGQQVETSAAAHDWVQGEDGAFELGGLAAGIYDLGALTVDGDSGILPGVALRAGEIRRGLVIKVGAGLTVQGRIVDLESRRPLGDVAVKATSGSRTGEGRSDATGAFRLERLLGGTRLELQVDRPGWLPYRRSFNPPVASTVFDLGDVPLCAQRPERAQTGRVGMVLTANDQGQILVSNALPTGPAARAGVKAGDAILSVNDWLVHNADLGAVVALVIDGEPGTPLLLEVRAPGGPARRMRMVRM